MKLHYRAPLWLPGGNAQTLWPVLQRRWLNWPKHFVREIWRTPDSDRIAVDWLEGSSPPKRNAPLLVLFHGLEGSRQRSHYALAFARAAVQAGWRFVLPHFRGCGGLGNEQPRAYHSGDWPEIDWILSRLRTEHEGEIFACGISLGGNALLCWAAERAAIAAQTVRAVAAFSAPLNLAASSATIDLGANRLLYARHFLGTMRRKMAEQLQRYPGLFDGERVAGAKTLREFDDAYTAPLHGFNGVDDYYARAASLPRLPLITLPALIINAKNDPFIPAAALPKPEQVPANITLFQPDTGGHAGFPGAHPFAPSALPALALQWWREKGAA